MHPYQTTKKPENLSKKLAKCGHVSRKGRYFVCENCEYKLKEDVIIYSLQLPGKKK